MSPRLRRMRLAGLPVAALLVSLALAPAASAHTGIQVGEFLLEVGWRDEPALVGQPNAVQVTIVNHDTEKPVADLAADALTASVATAGVTSLSFPLEAAFDAEEGEGPLGEYDAAVVPTAPGEYTFLIAGSIHGTKVDLAITSGPETFDPVLGSNDLEFPAKLPNLTEVGTRLDRLDARIAALQSADPGTGAIDAANAATAAAQTASAAADRALLVGAILGGGGLLVALGALVVAMRAGRRGAGTG
jgi:hypothetical protein